MPKPRGISVVDDDPSMLIGIENLLSAYGFATEVFYSAESFLDKFFKTPGGIDCVVVDIHLGGMSGIDLWRQLKISNSSLPVIFMTAFDDEAMRRRALDEGCVAYLRKPFPSHLLINALEKAGRRGQAKSS